MLEKRNIYNSKLDLETLWWVQGDVEGLGTVDDGPLRDWIEENSIWFSYCKNFRTVVQAGGLCGLYPLLYSRKFERVYTFEPSPWNFSALARNCWKPSIVKMNCALSNTNQCMSIYDGTPRNVGMHRMDFESNDGLIPSMKIDQLALPYCDLIHLDVEGAEERALRGAEATLDRFKPTVILEHARGENVLYALGYEKVYEGIMDTVYINKQRY